MLGIYSQGYDYYSHMSIYSTLKSTHFERC